MISLADIFDHMMKTLVNTHHLKNG